MGTVTVDLGAIAGKVSNLGTAAFEPTSAFATAADLESIAAVADSAVQSVVPGTNVTVDDTDPQNPKVSATGGSGGSSQREIVWDDLHAGTDQVFKALLTAVTSSSGSTGGLSYGLNPKTAGKWYFELICLAQSASGPTLGGGLCVPASVDVGSFLGSDTFGWGSWARGTSNTDRSTFFNNTNANHTTNAASAAGQSMRAAADIDAGKLWLSYWGSTTWIGGGDPATGTTPTFTFTAGTKVAPAASPRGVGALTQYVAEASLSSAVPTGFAYWPGLS